MNLGSFVSTKPLPVVRRVLTPVLDFLLPPRCVLCAEILAEQDGVCAPCWRKLKFLDGPICRISGAPLPFYVREEDMVLPWLRKRPPAYDRARAALVYDGEAAALIRRMKFRDEPALALLLAQWMRRVGERFLREADYILPVPLHARRLWTRRFNQAAELARPLADEHGRPMQLEWLARRRFTRQQIGLSRAARRRNLRGAFRVRADVRAALKGAHVVLVDDVFTTGATIDACARALKRAGVRHVDALTAARVVMPEPVSF